LNRIKMQNSNLMPLKSCLCMCLSPFSSANKVKIIIHRDDLPFVNN
jgi:DTW domain-containing protein YfiP